MQLFGIVLSFQQHQRGGLLRHGALFVIHATHMFTLIPKLTGISSVGLNIKVQPTCGFRQAKAAGLI